MLDYIWGTQVLLPADCRGIVKLIFTQHQQLLFHAHWQALCQECVAVVRQPGDPLHGITLDELMGLGPFLHTEAQALIGPNKCQEAILPTSLGKREDERALQPPRPDTSSCCQRLSPASLQPATASLQPATTGSLGMDVASSVAVTLMTTQPEKVPTGIKGPIIIDGQPMGALLLGRSSATMMGLFVLPGVIDADFTGEICVMVYIPFPPIQIEKGQRIAQLVPLEQITKSLAPRQSQLRGERGFGSTGGLTLLTMNLNDWPKCTNSINKDIYSFLLVPGIPLSLLVKRSRGNIVCYMIYGL
uniref:dUTPase-like domain-containing protein n=1 Tax=Geospiza parvula TaxID=87175 RepID=A0A8U8ANU5_GEOPR